MGIKSKRASQKENLIGAATVICMFAMYQTHADLKRHITECSARSAALAKIGVGVFVIVAAQILIMLIAGAHMPKLSGP